MSKQLIEVLIDIAGPITREHRHLLRKLESLIGELEDAGADVRVDIAGGELYRTEPLPEEEEGAE